MAVWRRKALDLFPELRHDIQQRSTIIFQLYFDLLPMALEAHATGDAETLGRVYRFAEWCLRQRTGDLRGAAAVAFYEHLVDDRDRRVWAAVLPWLPSWVIAEIWPLWQWRLAEHEEGVLRDLIAHPDLTPPLPGRRTVEPTPALVDPGAVDLGALEGADSHAWAINEAGAVVGWAETASGERHAVAWRDGRPVDLGTLGGRASGALAVNDVGAAAGWAETADGATHAALWVGQRAIDLGTLGGRESVALAINFAGQAVSWARTADGARRAVLRERGAATDLGTLGGRESVARAINADGTVVGWAETAGGEMRAVLWAPNRPAEPRRRWFRILRDRPR